jgi:hypothetical protein
MAELTAKKRKKMAASTFAVNGKKRKYPIPDEAHARNALARVSAHGTPEEKRKVKAAVKRKFPALAKRSKFIKERARA